MPRISTSISFLSDVWCDPIYLLNMVLGQPDPQMKTSDRRWRGKQHPLRPETSEGFQRQYKMEMQCFSMSILIMSVYERSKAMSSCAVLNQHEVHLDIVASY